MKKKSATSALLAISILLGYTGEVAAAADKTTPKEYVVWLENLKKEMIERGISAKTVEQVYAENDYYHPAPEVVKIDRNQNEFVLTFSDYINRVISDKRVETARQKYAELYPEYQALEDKYGVPFNYLVAFWGMESNFGQNFGKHQVIDALTTLSYDTRRPKFFKEELYQALKIIDLWQLDYRQMEGSWAGAMGNFQFMPSTFNAYAVDYNEDGKIDIWQSFGDAAASAANYLSKIGWKKDEPWGMEVSLPWNFDYAQSGRWQSKKLSEWSALGVKTADGKALPMEAGSEWSIILPEGRKGNAFIVGHNFKVIMKWNKSENYALAIGLLADYTVLTNKKKQQAQTPALRLMSDDVKKVQHFINVNNIGKLAEDGQLGSKTREMIQKLQGKAKMPADGYPDYQLLNKIDKYNSKFGFAIPVPPRKLHRGK